MLLLEREHELDVLRQGFRQVLDGAGTGVALSGDAGAGKSSTILAALRDAQGLRVLRGQCDPLGTPRPLGPFRDLGLRGIADHVSEAESTLSETAAAVLADLGTEPTVLVVEDLHWADAASVEVLRYLVRRVETVPLALVVSYRDVEIGPHHPARRLLGDLAVSDTLQTLSLRPLTVGGVATAVDGTGLDPVRVHELTGGNPFYVSQVASEPDRPLPRTVRDTVLARVSQVEVEDLEILQLVACAPDGLDDRVLAAAGVDLAALRRLDATTLLVHTGAGVAFRHELARQAIEGTIPPGGAPGLHQRILDSLERLDTRDPATLTHHAVAARNSERALLHARAAAAEALATASHTEAAAFLELALEHLPPRAPAAERAELLMQLTIERYLTARLADAITTARASLPLWVEAGRQDGVAEAHAALAVLEYQSGRRAASDRHADQACTLALDAGSRPTIARVHMDAGMLAAIVSHPDRAVECGSTVLDIGERDGEEHFSVAGRMLLEGVAALAGDTPARERVAELVDVARRRGWDELAWRGYIIVAVCLIEQGELRAAQHLVEDAIAHTVNRDLATMRLWHIGLRATVHAYSGRWSAAREDAAEVVASEALGGSPWPHLALAVTAMRTGEEDAGPHLDRAWATAQGVDDPMRYLPVLSAVAEHVWLTGATDPRITEFAVPRLAELGATPDTRWGVGSLVVWLQRLGLPVDLPADLPEPHRSHTAGHHREAADWWRRAGAPFSEATCLADSPDPEDRLAAVALLDRLGAVASADRLRRALREDGTPGVPARPTGRTRANPGGLTNRQLEVARLLARGFTNSEIAAEAFISPKTAEHHVSAVLAKLGLPHRRAVQQVAADLGLD